MASHGKQRFDPRPILSKIARDEGATPASRLRAIRLIAASEPKRRPKMEEPPPDPAIARAVELMRQWLSRPGAMPTVGEYRGVGVFDFQPPDRVEALVRPAIDAVLGIADPSRLSSIVCDVTQPPEARLLAKARYLARAQAKLAAHEQRLGGLARLEAAVAGLDSLLWQDPDRHCSLLDTWPTGTAAPPTRPPELASQLIESAA